VINAIKIIFMVIVVGAIALSLFAKNQHEKREKERAIEGDIRYAAERAWKDPLVRNCENAVRRISDPGTLKFGVTSRFFNSNRDTETIDKTDSGYLYYIKASDATTGNTPITMLCYTDRNGSVLRVVPQNQ